MDVPSTGDDNRRFPHVFIGVIVLIIIFAVFVIIIAIIASKYQPKEPNFFVNQVFVMNDGLSSHCPANWSMNFAIHNGNKYTSFFYKGFEVLAYDESDSVSDIFARAEIRPFSQGPKNKTVIRVEFVSLVMAKSYKSKTFSVEFRGIVYTRTNVAKFVRRMAQLDEENIIKGKCEDLMFGVKESTTTHSLKKCFFCYYSNGHKPCRY